MKKIFFFLILSWCVKDTFYCGKNKKEMNELSVVSVDIDDYDGDDERDEMNVCFSKMMRTSFEVNCLESGRSGKLMKRSVSLGEGLERAGLHWGKRSIILSSLSVTSLKPFDVKNIETSVCWPCEREKKVTLLQAVVGNTLAKKEVCVIFAENNIFAVLNEAFSVPQEDLVDEFDNAHKALSGGNKEFFRMFFKKYTRVMLSKCEEDTCEEILEIAFNFYKIGKEFGLTLEDYNAIFYEVFNREAASYEQPLD